MEGMKKSETGKIKVKNNSKIRKNNSESRNNYLKDTRKLTERKVLLILFQ